MKQRKMRGKKGRPTSLGYETVPPSTRSEGHGFPGAVALGRLRLPQPSHDFIELRGRNVDEAKRRVQ
jgi:hypothetical protein